MTPFLKPLLALFVLLLAGCSMGNYIKPYRVDVRQGNYVTQEMVSQLRPGMTRDQVRFVLGTPLVTDAFHGERWDYVYRFVPGRSQKVEQRHLSVFFKEDRLDRVGGDVTAQEGGTAAAAAEAPASRVIDIGAPAAQ